MSSLWFEDILIVFFHEILTYNTGFVTYNAEIRHTTDKCQYLVIVSFSLTNMRSLWFEDILIVFFQEILTYNTGSVTNNAEIRQTTDKCQYRVLVSL